jgi:hypothetical protein
LDFDEADEDAEIYSTIDEQERTYDVVGDVIARRGSADGGGGSGGAVSAAEAEVRASEMASLLQPIADEMVDIARPRSRVGSGATRRHFTLMKNILSGREIALPVATLRRSAGSAVSLDSVSLGGGAGPAGDGGGYRSSIEFGSPPTSASPSPTPTPPPHPPPARVGSASDSLGILGSSSGAASHFVGGAMQVAPLWIDQHRAKEAAITMTKDERARQEIMFEMVQKEKTFCRDLKVLLVNFAEPLCNKTGANSLSTDETAPADEWLHGWREAIGDLQLAADGLLADLQAKQAAATVVDDISPIFQKHTEAVGRALHVHTLIRDCPPCPCAETTTSLIGACPPAWSYL